MLNESVNSVLTQSWRAFELLICDDKSDDGSYSFLQNIRDERVKLFRNLTNRGLFPTLNHLIKNSSADLIKLWAQDDIMKPNCLEATIAFHRKHPEIAFSYCGCTEIDAEGKSIDAPFEDHTPEIISPKLHTKIAYYAGSISSNISNVTISKFALDDVGLFREDMKICGDFEMWVRLSEKYCIGRISEKLLKLRVHQGQFSRNASYYFYHLTEDQEIFRTLRGRLTDDLHAFADHRMKWHRHVYYFNLMLKLLVRGEFLKATVFLRELRKIDYVPILFLRWALVRLRRSVFGDHLPKDNKCLFICPPGT